MSHHWPPAMWLTCVLIVFTEPFQGTCCSCPKVDDLWRMPTLTDSSTVEGCPLWLILPLLTDANTAWFFHCCLLHPTWSMHGSLGCTRPADAAVVQIASPQVSQVAPARSHTEMEAESSFVAAFTRADRSLHKAMWCPYWLDPLAIKDRSHIRHPLKTWYGLCWTLEYMRLASCLLIDNLIISFKQWHWNFIITLLQWHLTIFSLCHAKVQWHFHACWSITS